MESNFKLPEHHIWLNVSLLKKIQLEGFKSRQSIWSALIAFEQDGILVSTPELNKLYKRHWRPLVNPKNYQVIQLGKEKLWWRFTKSNNIRLCSAIDEPHIAMTHQQAKHKTLTNINPWHYWVRSPEQASLRRALITEQKHALCLNAPRGSGMTLALTSAICDWLDAQVGECIFVTRSPRKAKAMLQALSKEHQRVHLISPQELIAILLNREPHVENQEHQNTQLSFLEEGSILADALSNEEWIQWSQWAAKQKDELGPWLDWIGALRRLILKRVVVLGSPSTNPSTVRERLKDLPDNWLTGLANLGQQLWESEHLECLRALEEVNDIDWPWPKAKALIIDDCLSLPWTLIYKTLKFADDYLGVSGRKWSLMLASSGEGGQSVTGVRQDEIETLVSGVLGRHIIPLSLHYSERLPQNKILGIRELSQEHIKSIPHQNSLQLSSSLHLSQKLKTEASYPLWHVDQDNFDHDQNLKRLLETCLATPGAFVLDLSPRPQLSLYDRLVEKDFITTRMLQRIIKTHDLEDREVQWLIAYRGHHSHTKQALIPEVLNRLEETDFQGLYYLLTRSPTPLIWLGDFQLKVRLESHSFDEVLEYISSHSPWLGQGLFKRLNQAEVLFEQGDINQSLEHLEQCQEAIKQVLSAKQITEYEQILVSIYHRLVTSSIQQENWSRLNHVVHSLCRLNSAQVQPSIDDFSIAFDQSPAPESLGLITKEQIDSKTYTMVLSSLSDLISQGEDKFRSQDLNGIEKLIEQFVAIMNSSIASLCYEQIKSTCWLWSKRILALPVPQANLQKALIELLVMTSPSSIEYQILKPAYQQTPSPLVLTQIALQILDLDEANSEADQQKRLWSHHHLQR